MYNQSNTSQEILNQMHKAMMKAPFIKSGSIEKDFLANMIPHHQGAVDSSKFLLQNKLTNNDKLIKLAKEIILTQEKEITEFEQILKENSYTTTQIQKKTYKDFVNDERNIMHKMHANMNISKSNTPQKAFIEAMIAHHQGAVDLSEQILLYSKDKKIRKIAENIINTQEKEIAEFKALLKNQ